MRALYDGRDSLQIFRWVVFGVVRVEFVSAAGSCADGGSLRAAAALRVHSEARIFPLGSAPGCASRVEAMRCRLGSAVVLPERQRRS